MRLRTFTIAVLVAASAAIASAKVALPFVENDYAKALAKAKAENLPLFVDGWAPW